MSSLPRLPRELHSTDIGTVIGGTFAVFAMTEAQSSGMGDFPLRPARTPDVARTLFYMPYEQYLRTDAWYYTSETAKDLAGRKCILCGDTRNLNSHHLTYERKGSELANDIAVLCHTCHMEAHRMTDPKKRR